MEEVYDIPDSQSVILSQEGGSPPHTPTNQSPTLPTQWSHYRSFRGGWIEGLSEQGEVYFYNTRTGESAWELPPGATPLQANDLPPGMAHLPLPSEPSPLKKASQLVPSSDPYIMTHDDHANYYYGDTTQHDQSYDSSYANNYYEDPNHLHSQYYDNAAEDPLTANYSYDQDGNYNYAHSASYDEDPNYHYQYQYDPNTGEYYYQDTASQNPMMKDALGSCK